MYIYIYIYTYRVIIDPLMCNFFIPILYCFFYMIYLYSIKLLSLLILYFINLFIREKKTSKKSRKIESSQEKRKTIEIIAMSIYINIM